MTKNLLQKSVKLCGILLLSVQLNVNAQQNTKLINDYLKQEQVKNGWLQSDVENWYQSDYYVDETSGLTYAYVQQRHHHIIVYNAISIFLVKDNKVLHFTPGIIDHLATKVKTSLPSITAEEAIGHALAHLGRTQTGEVKLTGSDTDLNKFIFDAPGISASPLKVQLVYRAMDEGIFLSWDVSIELKDESHWWNIRINALNGDYLDKNDWTANCSFDGSAYDCTIHEDESMVPFSPPAPLPPSPVPAEYEVFPFPIEAPSFGSRSILFNPSDNTASPHGWHDVNGVTGAEYTITRGNNVHAYEDANNDNLPGYSPNSASLQFDYALDLAQAPLVNQDASITNLFYLNNRIHDVLYLAGFTEAAGNFQQNNYGNGGLGNDYVKAEAFDGGGTNNANFATPADGSSGRMQMYLWTAPNPDRDGSFDNGIVAHEYGHGLSNRLTGGPANSSCLGNAEQGGEGWSDWLALIMTTEPGDTTGGGMLTQARGIGTYALNQATSGLGIRRYRYSVNMAINPQTYADLATSSGPHAKGEIWCDAIWDMSSFLINDLGFNSNPTVTTSGNYIAMRLVLEGMKLQPCSPGYLDARDAILAADAVLYNNAHRCRIWEAFARRGMGFNAIQGSSSSSTDQTAGFSMPPVCLTATQPPVAAFTSNVSTIACASNVSFTDQSTQPFSWLWNFGDNTTSTLQNPVHAYNAPGTYSVKLVVTNTLGSDSIVHTITVTSTFTANVNVTPSAVCSGSTVQLNAAGSGSNNITYNVSSIAYAPVAGTGTTVTLADDAMSTVKPIGFTFNFFGQNYTNFYICSNGFITFSAGQPATIVYGVPIPTTATPNNYIALAWNDLYPPAAGSSVSYFNTGVAPNRKLIVKYSTWHYLGGTTYPFIVQAILSEGSNQVEIHTTTISNVSAADASAKTTQGLENSSGSAGVAVPGRNSAHFTATNDAYRFTPVINYTYTWQPGSLNGATQTVTPASTGTYTVSVGDGSGCIIPFTSPVITVNPNPVPAISGNSAICSGNSTILNAGTFSGYSWSTGATTQTISVSTAGTFTVTVTNASGCTGSASRTTTVNPAPAPSISGTLSFCSGSSTTLNAGVFPGYSWSTGATTQTISANTAGTFTVTVTNASGCTGSTSATTTVNANPIPSVSGNLSFCTGSSTTLNAGVFTTYNWSTGATTQTISVNTANTFTVTVTNSSGCTGSTSVTTTVTTELNPTISGNLSFCSGSSTILDLGAGYSSYSWSTGATTQTITINTAGSWAGTVTLNGCSGTSPSVTTTITPAPTATVSGNSVICLAQAATLNLTFSGTGPWNYTVSDGSQTVSGSSSTSSASLNITPATAGTHNYSITVLSDANCSGPGSGTAVVIVNSARPANSFITSVTGPTAGACNGDVYLVTANSAIVAGTTYEWSTGGNAPVVLFSNSQTGPFVASPFATTGNTVWAQFGALINGTYYYACAKAVNGCGPALVHKCLSVRGTTGIPGAITPANPVACPNEVKNYSCGTSSGATLYNWTLAGSASPITSGQGTQNVQVTFPPAFTSGQLCVTGSLLCGGSSTSAPRCVTITNNPAVPGAMTGPTKICPGENGVVYSVPLVTGASGYNWTVPAVCTIGSGQNTNSITVNFPNPYTGAQSVCVTALSPCGTSTARCKSVGSYLPGQPGTITGPTSNICGSTVQYSISNLVLATGYDWTTPAGTTITGGQGTTTILLNVSPVFTTGSLTVTAYTNLCTPGTSAPRSITLSGKPNTPAVITANPLTWCSGEFVNFSTPAATPLPTYNWIVTNSTIQAGQGSSDIDVEWGSGTGNVKVTASNGCGVSNIRSQNFSSSCREEGEELSVIGYQLSVYPNPAHDNITVSMYLKEASALTLQLMDVTGRIVISENRTFSEGLNNYELRLNQLAKGIYLLEVRSVNGSGKTKVVVE